MRCLAWLACASIAAECGAQGTRLIEQGEYADRLRGMWLGECIANWTGIRAEGARTQPPFLTDADWGTNPPGTRGRLEFVLDQDPWRADDDTDIEYVYLHLIDAWGSNVLSADRIRAGWLEHINRFIWVSNRSARTLMDRNIAPPGTGMAVANPNWLMIDAQLTTEFFGALAPGMPEEALALADLPIATTAGGHAGMAARFFVVLYALASQTPPDLSPRDRNLWLVGRGRAFLPDGSKAADMVDFVVGDYLSNPDRDDWERTRDLIYARYQRDAAANGFVYRAWYESSVNFATAVMALLYGEGDFARTVRIGTLSGWDADNPTATMGGLLGLMLGEAGIRAAFPKATLSSRYWVSATRDGLPDRTPGEDGEDRFDLMAERMLPMVERTVVAAGGLADPTLRRWLLPPVVTAPPRMTDRAWADWTGSGTRRVRSQGGAAIAYSSVNASPWGCQCSGNPAMIANGLELNWDGREPAESDRWQYSSRLPNVTPGLTVELGVTYDRPVRVAAVRFIEGDQWAGADEGGWFQWLAAELRVGSTWIPLPPGTTQSEPLDPTRPFQVIDWTLPSALEGVTGVRVRGPVGGAWGYATCLELDTLDERPSWRTSFDQNADGEVDVEDQYAWHAHPVDLDGDGVADWTDMRYLEYAVRWREIEDMTWPWRR